MSPAAEATRPIVGRCWPGATVICLGSGPSAPEADLGLIRQYPTIAVKDAIRLAPWAGALYCGEPKWWARHGAAGYTGPRYSIHPTVTPHAQVLQNTGILGLEEAPTGLRTGKNSGYQAINLAYHLGAARVVLVGYDMRPDAQGRHHWFGSHPYPTLDPPYPALLEYFGTIAGPLAARGVEVLNATPDSALSCFRRATLEEALR